MAAKRITMRKIREILRLRFSAELTIRQISVSTKISVGSIQNILKLVEQQGLSWPLPDDLGDQALAFFRQESNDDRTHPQPATATEIDRYGRRPANLR